MMALAFLGSRFQYTVSPIIHQRAPSGRPPALHLFEAELAMGGDLALGHAQLLLPAWVVPPQPQRAQGRVRHTLMWFLPRGLRLYMV